MFTVYKITNTLNDKYYIGVHKTDDPHDNYMGSGPAIRRAIKKYGKHNFIKEILFVYEIEQEAYEKEKELLNVCWQLDECYNMTQGGEGSWKHVDNFASKNCMKNPDIVKKVFEKRRSIGTTDAMKKAAILNGSLGAKARKGMKDSEEVKQRRSDSVKKALSEDETKKKHKDAIRAFRCEPYRLIDPDGKEYNTDVISELCAELDLPLSTVTTHNDGRTIKRGKLKGWTIYKKDATN